MTPDEARKLLGGYATGTLTPEERAALFSAALDDQELFDALAQDQALKETLDDPRSRAELLDSLNVRPRPAWLRWWPAPLAAAVAAVALFFAWPSSRQPSTSTVEIAESRPLPAPAQSEPPVAPAPTVVQITPRARAVGHETGKPAPALVPPATLAEAQQPAPPVTAGEVANSAVRISTMRADAPSAMNAERLYMLGADANVLSAPGAAGFRPSASPALARKRSEAADQSAGFSNLGIKYSVSARTLTVEPNYPGTLYAFRRNEQGEWVPSAGPQSVSAHAAANLESVASDQLLVFSLQPLPALTNPNPNAAVESFRASTPAPSTSVAGGAHYAVIPGPSANGVLVVLIPAVPR